jgi:amidase
MTAAIAVLKERGAVVVDPADIPSVIDEDVSRDFLRWEVCRGADGPKGMDAGCSVVFKYGMKRDFNKWLASLGPNAPVKSLTELRLWNLAHTRPGALKYGQSQLDIFDEMDVDADRARYQIDRAKDIALSGPHGIDEIMRVEQLDAAAGERVVR